MPANSKERQNLKMQNLKCKNAKRDYCFLHSKSKKL